MNLRTGVFKHPVWPESMGIFAVSLVLLRGVVENAKSMKQRA